MEEIGPGWRGGVLEIGHEHPGPGVEGVDHHLGVDRTGYLHPAVGQVVGDRVDQPIRIPDLAGLDEEVGALPFVDATLTLPAIGEDLFPLSSEFLLQVGEKRDRLGGEDPPLDLRCPDLAHKMAVSLSEGYNSNQVNAKNTRSFGESHI